MAVTTAAELPTSSPTAMPAVAGAHVRRRISPEAGHALEILGHAIEYLTDEYVQRRGTLSADDPELKAVQLLMALNRQIYFECPVSPTFTDRLLELFHLWAA